MLTSGRKVLKAFARSTTALLSVVMLASCTSGEPEAKNEQSCGISPSSEEGALLKGILRAEGFESLIYNSTSEAATALRHALPETTPESRMSTKMTCALWVAGQNGGDRVTFSFGWVSRASKKAEEPLPNGIPFEADGGVFGQTNDTETSLFVACEMPGKLGEPSKSAWFHANALHNVSPPRTDIDQTVRDRQTALTYLMARRVTDALGCENKPLEKPPVVKPLPAP
ncbi:hypothetical protein OG594_07040 [Streptomyces sp. NBC_01214]|uniref:hypothetical protein n=1 Tax=Streptomyces sp. NBC_01214 TaxID=2903777 RepID=UPI002254A776|nr:hypothetical protein [Streptomyces sp. NBC_01214]MCX4801409.1 hypothetical protein [Streptomyces sp. NBC_01214]